MEQPQWEVEKILERGRFNNLTYYLVKWVGYPLQEATWEPITNLDHCQQSICKFQNALKQQIKQKRKENRKKKNKKNTIQKTKDQEKQPEQEYKVNFAQKPNQPPEVIKKIQGESDEDHHKVELFPLSKQKIGVPDDLEVKSKKGQLEQLQPAKCVDQKETQQIKELIVENNGCLSKQPSILQLYQADPSEDHDKKQNIYQPDKIQKLIKGQHLEQPQINRTEPLKEIDEKMNNQKTEPKDIVKTDNSLKIQHLQHFQQKGCNEQLTPPAVDQTSFFSLLFNEREVKCDEMYQKGLCSVIRQIFPLNIRKMEVDSSFIPAMLDLRENPSVLEQLGPISITKKSDVLMKVKALVRFKYGWTALGYVAENLAMVRVDKLTERSWKSCISR